MKIALCQINPTVGAFKKNKDLILRNYMESIDNGADIVVFPEMSITGYPIADLLYENGFVNQNMIILDEISSKSTKPLILGYVHNEDGRLFNSAAICINGKQSSFMRKFKVSMHTMFKLCRRTWIKVCLYS